MQKGYAVERAQSYLIANENALSEELREALKITVELAQSALRLANDIKELTKEDKS